MLHELLKRKEIFKKTSYNPCETISTVFSAVKELLKFNDITGTLYIQNQAVHINYVVIHRKSKFVLSICECNWILTIHKTWVGFKQLFWTAHQKLRMTTDLTIQDAGMHHTNIMCDVVEGLQEVLQEKQAPIKNSVTMHEKKEHVTNKVQDTQQQLAAQLQKMQIIMQAM